MPAPKGNKYAKGNKGGGRKSKLTATNKRVAEAMYKMGATDKQVADELGVCEATVNNWKKQEEEFFKALKDWKLAADAKVEKSLYERATGYSHPDVHISNYLGSITTTPITKHYPPDTTAGIFWLKNRLPEQWRDKQEHEHSGKGGGDIPVKHTMDFGGLSPEERKTLGAMVKRVAGNDEQA